MAGVVSAAGYIQRELGARVHREEIGRLGPAGAYVDLDDFDRNALFGGEHPHAARARCVAVAVDLHARLLGAVLRLLLVTRRRPGDRVRLAEPGAEVDELAAFAAERPVGERARPFDAGAASRAFDGRDHAPPVTCSRSG